METSYDVTKMDALVGRIFAIDDITLGNPEKDYIARYRGHLRSADSEAAYDQLSSQLEPMGVTPLFRIEDDRHVVILEKSRPKPKPSNPRVNLIMFLLTLVAVLFAGSDESVLSASNPLEMVLAVLKTGWPFAVSLLAILLTHEFGHYLMSRHYGLHATLPYFIPFLPPLGTMGAVIVMKEVPKSRKHLLDIGLAGPLSGLVVTIPVLILGLSLSKLDPLPTQAAQASQMFLEGNSILYLGLKYLMFGQLLPAPASYGGVPVLLYWLRFFFTGQPFPLGGLDVSIHTVALAGWAGLLVTGLNLIPSGQLDGGHVIYVLLGRKGVERLRPIILVILAGLGFFWFGWWLWFALIFFLGRAYDDPLDQITPINPLRKALAIAALVIFFLVFIPIPITTFTK